MAARRLIIVLVVLFAVSIVAALIAPDRRGGLIGDRSSTEATSTTTTSAPEETRPAGDALPSGEALTVRIDASTAKPERVEAFVGDQLALEVGSDRAREIEIPAFGVTEDAAPDAPANFDLLLREPGTLEVLDADAGKVLGLLEVARPKSAAERG